LGHHEEVPSRGMEIHRNSAIALRCHTMVAITKRGSP
jgi:hypothetical protein